MLPLLSIYFEKNNFGLLFANGMSFECVLGNSRHLLMFEVSFSHFHDVMKYSVLINERLWSNEYVKDVVNVICFIRANMLHRIM